MFEPRLHNQRKTITVGHSVQRLQRGHTVTTALTHTTARLLCKHKSVASARRQQKPNHSATFENPIARHDRLMPCTTHCAPHPQRIPLRHISGSFTKLTKELPGFPSSMGCCQRVGCCPTARSCKIKCHRIMPRVCSSTIDCQPPTTLHSHHRRAARLPSVDGILPESWLLNSCSRLQEA
jgi:hypothetical protein